MSAPVRYVSRDGSAAPTAPRGCPLCGTVLPSARARFCSAACKQRAFRLRQGDAAGADPTSVAAELKRRGQLRAHTLYECPACGERSLGQQRCPECHRFGRVLGLGGACPHCDEPILAAELLGEEGVL
jgi:hypothetical protein